MQFVLERSLIQASEVLQIELAGLTLATLNHRDSNLARRVTCWVFISWELLPLTFFKVNFDGSEIDNMGGAGSSLEGLSRDLLL